MKASKSQVPSIMSEQHYLDNAATTRLSDKVLAAMWPYFQEHYGNPSSLHSLGVEADKALKRARKSIARELGIESRELFFTSGGTESNNLALKGIARALRRRGKHIICSSIEHPSVLETCRELADKDGFRLTEIAPQSSSCIAPEQVFEALEDDTILVTIMHVQNETGAIHPVDEIARGVALRTKVTVVHVDGAQALGKVAMPCESVHSYSFSGHKIHGPKGIGGLVVRGRARPLAQLTGGGQESGLRSGTENLAGIVGLAAAVEEVMSQRPSQVPFWEALRGPLVTGIEALGGHINSPEDSAPSIVNVSFPGHPAEVILHLLESQGVYVSNGSACASKKSKGSHVLRALGLSSALQKSALRLSMGWQTTEDDIRAAVRALEKALEELGPVIQEERKSRLG
jgi:cysteine desulfurase